MITYFGEMWLNFDNEDERERTTEMLRTNGFTVRNFNGETCVDFARRSLGDMQDLFEVITAAEGGVSSLRMLHE